MEHSIALGTDATTGLGYAAVQLAAATKTKMFTPIELDLNALASAPSAPAELVKRGGPIDVLLFHAGFVSAKKRVIVAAGVEASQACSAPILK